MPSPIPGMDPYLEAPDLWPDVHHAFIAEMQGELNAVLRPEYVARIELRVYVETDGTTRQVIPDARIEKTNGKGRRSRTEATVALSEPKIVPIVLDEEVEEARLEIKHVKTGDLVTVIEVLSPSNKIVGSEGRKSFMKKRRETLVSPVNWVEIDLLRSGEPSQPMKEPSDYRVLVARGTDNYVAQFWPISVRQALPTIGIPLRDPDPDVPLNLGAVLQAAYDRAAYDLTVDYSGPADPPLAKDDAKWADKVLRSRGLR